MTNKNEVIKCLENFIYNNKELQKLESLINDFNIFSALGIVRKEVRHSNFLTLIVKYLNL